LPAIYYHQLAVQSEEIDGLQHVNNVAFVKWMQDAAIAHSSAQGWDAERYRESGTAWIVRTHFVRYLQPALKNDSIVVQTWVVNVRKVTSLRRYRVFRESDRKCVAEAETDWAFVSRERQLPVRIPIEVRQAFETVELERPEFHPPDSAPSSH